MQWLGLFKTTLLNIKTKNYYESFFHETAFFS